MRTDIFEAMLNQIDKFETQEQCAQCIRAAENFSNFTQEQKEEFQYKCIDKLASLDFSDE